MKLLQSLKSSHVASTFIDVLDMGHAQVIPLPIRYKAVHSSNILGLQGMPI